MYLDIDVVVDIGFWNSKFGGLVVLERRCDGVDVVVYWGDRKWVYLVEMGWGFIVVDGLVGVCWVGVVLVSCGVGIGFCVGWCCLGCDVS